MTSALMSLKIPQQADIHVSHREAPPVLHLTQEQVGGSQITGTGEETFFKVGLRLKT